MGTLAAGIKDIFSTAKTTGTNVMLSANDGTPDGHISMENLASALGVILKNLPSQDLNDVKEQGVYGYGYNIANAPANTSVLVVYNRAGRVVQMCYPTDVSVATGAQPPFIRNFTNNAWSTWSLLSADIPAFYKSYDNLAGLASALGLDKCAISTGGNTNTDGWYKVATYRTAIGGYNSFVNIRGMMNNYSSTTATNINIACAALDGSRPTFHVIEGANILGFVQDGNVTNLYAKPLRGYGFVLSFLTNSTTIQIISTPDIITTEPEGITMLT